MAMAFAGLFAVSASAAVECADIIKQVSKGKFEDALKSRSKIANKLTDSKEKLLFDISECMLYNSPKYAKYNPVKAYKLYVNISYSDYLYDRKVMDALRENKMTIESLCESIESNLMKYAKEKNKVEAYDEIISVCQGCSYLSDAKAQRETLIFNSYLKNATVKDVEKFLSDYPDSPKRAAAVRLRDSLAFVALQPSADAYSQYISMYPKSNWVPVIQSKLEKIAYEEAKKKDDINTYAKYIANYPGNEKKVSEFKEKIAKLEKSNVWLVPAKYDNIALVTDSLAGKSYYLVKEGRSWGILAEDATKIADSGYEEFGTKVDQGYIAAKYNGRWGVVELATGRPIGTFDLATSLDMKPMNKRFIAVKKSGKWGLLANDSRMVIEPFMEGSLSEFNIRTLSNGGVAMNYYGQLVIVDAEGNQLMNETFDEVSWRTTEDIDSRFIKTRRGKKYGLVNDKGIVMFDPEFDMLPYFDSDGIASVKNVMKEGWIDTTGRYLYFGSLSYFRDCGGSDKMIAYEVGGKIGFMSKVDDRKIPLSYSQLGDCFSNGLAKVKKGDKWMYINANGDEVCSIPDNGNAKMTYSANIIVVKEGSNFRLVTPTGAQISLEGYQDVDDAASCGFLRVKKNGKWGAIDYSGREVVPATYDEMTKFCNCYSIVRKGGKYGMLYKSSVVLDPVYDRLLDGGHFFDSNCNSYSEGKESNVFYIQASQGADNENFIVFDGKILIKTKDDVKLDKPSNLYTIVKLAEMGIYSNAKVGLIDPKGKILVKPIYSNIKLMPGGDKYFIYTSLSSKKQGMLDDKGAEATPAIADRISSFDGNLLYLKNGDDKTCYTKSGIPVLPKGYDVDGRILKDKSSGKFGVMDDFGNIRLYPNYSKVVGATQSTAVVVSDGKYGVVKY